MKFVSLATLMLAAAIVSAQGGGVPQVPASSESPEVAQKVLAKLEKEYVAAKKALAKSPKDAKAKKKFADAGAKFGHESMMSPALSPRIKYRQALRVYREVLKVDPKNSVAKPEYDLIVSIYKQMGRPVPQD